MTRTRRCRRRSSATPARPAKLCHFHRCQRVAIRRRELEDLAERQGDDRGGDDPLCGPALAQGGDIGGLVIDPHLSGSGGALACLQQPEAVASAIDELAEGWPVALRCAG